MLNRLGYAEQFQILSLKLYLTMLRLSRQMLNCNVTMNLFYGN